MNIFVVRDIIVKLQKNLTLSVWQELYSHKNTVDTALAVIKFVKIIKSLTLITLVLDESDNAVKIETDKDINTDFVSIRSDIISLKLWKRMKKKFNSLIKSVN